MENVIRHLQENIQLDKAEIIRLQNSIDQHQSQIETTTKFINDILEQIQETEEAIKILEGKNGKRKNQKT